MNRLLLQVMELRDDRPDGLRRWRVSILGNRQLGAIRKRDGQPFEARRGDRWVACGDSMPSAISHVIADAPEAAFEAFDMRPEDLVLHVPLAMRKGQLSGSQTQAVIQGRDTLDYVVKDLLERSFEGLRLLDYGCGVKFTQALLQFPQPIAAYAGLDIDATMISFLSERVHDTRFSFAALPFHNDLYTTTGEEMRADTALPVAEAAFDLVTMQSVLTHFNPHDFETCLRMLRRYLADNGRVWFTLIANPRQKEPFLDLDAEQPLLRASYSEDHARQLVESAGYEIEVFRRRGEHDFLPEHILCRPTSVEADQ